MVGRAGLQVPQVPLSHELGTLTPAPRSVSSRLRSAGTSIVLPLRASCTVKGTLSALASAAPMPKSSKCTALVGQWPVMSRTASINPRGPQQ